jgi:hypothetical protein
MQHADNIALKRVRTLVEQGIERGRHHQFLLAGTDCDEVP